MILNRKISFIGTGVMGGAILERLITAGFVSADTTLACDINQDTLNRIRHRFNVRTSVDIHEAARFGDVIVLGVLPKQARQLLEQIRDSLSASKILVSLMALVSTDFIQETLRSRVRVARVMPNIPSLVGAGFNVVSFGRYISSEDKDWVKSFLNVLGEYREVNEEMMEVYSMLSAMGPTYFLPFADSLMEFGVNEGLSYEETRKAVALTLRGTAELMSKVDQSVEDLKNMIGTQPLKTHEPELKAMMEEELSKTLQQITVAKEKLAK
jgi:pyrroline-5-carboxylate reductase